MKKVELYLTVRRAIIICGMSRRAAAAYFGINRKTVGKMLVFPEPPQHGRRGGYIQQEAGGFHRDH